MLKYRSLKRQALTLRAQGFSYAIISQKIGIPKATLSGWLSNVPYSPNKAVRNRIALSTKNLVEGRRKDKKDSLFRAATQAEKDIGVFSARDIFMLGIGIYIGEGSKTASVVRVVNSDPRIITFSIKWLKLVCGLKMENFRIRLHLYPDCDKVAAESYWSKETGLERRYFQSAQIDSRKNKRKDRKGKLPYGTAHVSVVSRGKKEFGVYLFRRIHFWMEKVLA